MPQMSDENRRVDAASNNTDQRMLKMILFVIGAIGAVIGGFVAFNAHVKSMIEESAAVLQRDFEHKLAVHAATPHAATAHLINAHQNNASAHRVILLPIARQLEQLRQGQQQLLLRLPRRRGRTP